MNIREVLERYKQDKISAQEAEKVLKLDFLERIGNHAVFDHAREARRGIPEIVLGSTKSPESVADIVQHVLEDRGLVIVSRATPLHHEAVRRSVGPRGVRWEEKACMVVVDRRKSTSKSGLVGILTAGTSDVRVA